MQNIKATFACSHEELDHSIDCDARIIWIDMNRIASRRADLHGWQTLKLPYVVALNSLTHFSEG